MHGKLSLRFIDPFEVLERIEPIAYRVALPPWLAGTHDVFHVFVFRRYVFDPVHVNDFTSLELSDNMSYEGRRMRILARETKELCDLVIPYVKIEWSHHEEREATWEPEDEMRIFHPYLFETPS